MSEKKDTFWKLFLAGTAFVVMVFVVYAAILVAQQGTLSFSSPSLFDPSRDPFAQAASPVRTDVVLSSAFFYRDAIPLGAYNASWNAEVTFQSRERTFEGSRAMKAHFPKDGGGIAIEGEKNNTSGYDGISLAIYPQELGTTTLTLVLYNTEGLVIGSEPLAWYADGAALQEGRWQDVAIPLANITTAAPQILGGFAVEANGPGTVYVDLVRLSAHAPPHTRWEPPPEVSEENLLALLLNSAKAVPLPYTLKPTQGVASLWHVLYGRFTLEEDYVSLAPPPEGTDGMFVLLGGQDWNNYQVDAVVDWGSSSTFALLVRFLDDRHFASCNFSLYGSSVQLYGTQNGKPQLVGETPELPVPDTNKWSNVLMGARVVEDRVVCLVRGQEVLSGTLPTLPQNGTVGVEVWDNALYREPHHLHSLTVKAVP